MAVPNPNVIGNKLLDRYRDWMLSLGVKTEEERIEIGFTVTRDWEVKGPIYGTEKELHDFHTINRDSLGSVHTHPHLVGYDWDDLSPADVVTVVYFGWSFDGLIYSEGKDFYFWIAAFDTAGEVYRSYQKKLSELRSWSDGFNAKVDSLAEKYKNWQEVPQTVVKSLWQERSELDKARDELYEKVAFDLIANDEALRSRDFWLGRGEEGR